MKSLALFWCALLVGAHAGWAQSATPLWERAYSVIPAPRKVQLRPEEIVFGSQWTVDDSKCGGTNLAARALISDLAQFHSIRLALGPGPKVIRLEISPGAVVTQAEPGLDAQAYRLAIDENVIVITGNAAPGLFYGAQTLAQLPKRAPDGRWLLPRGLIEDWPALQLRFLHWDTKHHQDRMETLKRYLDWSARLKINMIGFELEDKFAYPSHPVIGAPGAFTPAQLQEIVDYGLERFIQVVPVIQAPAHVAYVLKHPEFSDLRADGNNYQSKLSDPRTRALIFSMYDDVIRATRGVDYLFASTDEVYYAGIEGVERPYTPENRSLAWVDFVQRAHQHLGQQGRRMLVWAEFPLLTKHVEMLPADIIDGVIGDAAYLPIEKRRGMRQLAYVSMQGEELLFPDHLTLDKNKDGGKGHLDEAFESIASGKHWQGNPIGAFGAAWSDSGLHNETFWLGWSAVAQYGWNPGSAPVSQHIREFMSLYYGPGAEGMIEIYRDMQSQARAWEQTWERVVSRARGPGYGSSHGKGQGTTRYDRTLSAPAVPVFPDLKTESVINKKYEKFVAEAFRRRPENERLIVALQANLNRVERNRYNLEVFLALARFMGHHWRLLDGLAEAEKMCQAAQTAAQKKDPASAMGHLSNACKVAHRLNEEGDQIFRDLTAVFEKSRYPKGQTVDGRKFVHVLDDTKDHWADRTPDLGYMMAPERSIRLEQWRESVLEVLARYGRENRVPPSNLDKPPPPQ